MAALMHSLNIPIPQYTRTDMVRVVTQVQACVRRSGSTLSGASVHAAASGSNAPALGEDEGEQQRSGSAPLQAAAAARDRTADASTSSAGGGIGHCDDGDDEEGEGDDGVERPSSVSGLAGQRPRSWRFTLSVESPHGRECAMPMVQAVEVSGAGGRASRGDSSGSGGGCSAPSWPPAMLRLFSHDSPAPLHPLFDPSPPAVPPHRCSTRVSRGCGRRASQVLRPSALPAKWTARRAATRASCVRRCMLWDGLTDLRAGCGCTGLLGGHPPAHCSAKLHGLCAVVLDLRSELTPFSPTYPHTYPLIQITYPSTHPAT